MIEVQMTLACADIISEVHSIGSDKRFSIS